MDTSNTISTSISSDSALPIQSVKDDEFARHFGGIIATGSPNCTFNKRCSNRSVPGHHFCGPHGGKLTLREDGTLKIIGPGTYRAIATLAGLNHRYVSQVLQGKSNPTSNVLDKIARVVGVEIGWLVDYINGQKEAAKG